MSHATRVRRQPAGLFRSEVTPHHWFDCHARALAALPAPKDRRLPGFIRESAKQICALRHAIEWLRISLANDWERMRTFTERLRAEPSGQDFPADTTTGELANLMATALSRIDWRERDILEMLVEYLEHGASGSSSSLAAELAALEQLQGTDPAAYEATVQGLISEARGTLPGLLEAQQSIACSTERETVDRGSLKVLFAALVEAFGIPDGDSFADKLLDSSPDIAWNRFYRRAAEAVGDLHLPLKLFEKAVLYLLETLPLKRSGHRSFVRYLIEEEAAYRRLLAAMYAPAAEQEKRLRAELDRFNRLPENLSDPVAYSPEEMTCLLQAITFRPDVVEAIAEREQHKDLYQVIAGLGGRARLPRVLHEVQNIFGYITPEAFDKIVTALQLEPVDVIRVIASYKQYSVDPRGDILIYVCKGTACFLRGQPELSRRLVAEIEAEAGAVGKHGIQFIEMDCFGVCHLAPVVKTEDRFLGNRTAADIPPLLEELRHGPQFDNRAAFLARILERLAPKRTGRLPGMFTISQVIRCNGAGGTQPESSASDPNHWIGQPLQIDSDGQLHMVVDGRCQRIGQFVRNTLGFQYRSVSGQDRFGCLTLSDSRHIQSVLHFPSDWLEADLAQSIKPTASVQDDFVWVHRARESVRLGPYTDRVLTLERNGNRFLLVIEETTATSAPAFSAAKQRSREKTEEAEFVHRQDRLVLGFAATAAADDIESYRQAGGYEAVFRVLGLRNEPAWPPELILRTVTEAHLRGRGGAGFPTGRKWQAMARAQCTIEEADENPDPIKLIVANGDEGDPGAFMDRTLIQERPHQLVEGMILAAIAVGARYGVIYVRKEYEDAVRRLENALFQARRKGFLGFNIFGVNGLHFDLEIRLGAGAFVAGEKRAIMRAIEGKPAEPTLKAISNTRRGLWGKPTLLNNVETFANVPLILSRGPQWYRRQGTRLSGGSKIFSVAGIVRQTGLVEVRFGRTLADIIRICGGIQETKTLAGVQIGGPSGAILSLTGVRSYLLDTPLDFDTFNQAGAMLGSGGLVFIGEDDDVVRLARHFIDWLAEESCGQCPPCFRGTVSLGETLDSILLGEGTGSHIHALWAKSDSIKAGSRCGLGTTAANPVTSALRFFPHAFLHAVLGNPQLTPLDCFQTLEALHLLTRDDVVEIRGSKRNVVGSSFVLKKPLFLHLVTELERLDRYRPPHGRRAQRFLDLLGVPAREVGLRDIVLEVKSEQWLPVGAS